MATAKERFDYGNEHAGDAGSLWREENLRFVEQQYEIERIMEALGIPLNDTDCIEEDVDAIIEKIRELQS